MNISYQYLTLATKSNNKHFAKNIFKIYYF